MEAVIRQLSQTLQDASASRTPLRIAGGGSKAFYGNPCVGETLSVAAYRGIIDYEPTELVISARAGTPLAELEAALRDKGQMLAFEPPHFDNTPPSPPPLLPGGEGSFEQTSSARPMATLGGCIAAGLSGPRRPYAGAVRDLILGVRILDGKGTELRFGGQVMKNVAGYDVSRLMAGSLGTLGVILDVSLKTLPLPATELTLHLQYDEADAIRRLNAWAAQPLPISATAWCGGDVGIRLSGAASAVEAACRKLGGTIIDQADAQRFWRGLRDHADDFFARDEPLWRLSVKSTAPPLGLPGTQMIEWNGALRWLRSDAPADIVRAAAAAAGGHATLFRRGNAVINGGVFHPLSPALAQLHRRLKQTFDPAAILNPGRLYPDL